LVDRGQTKKEEKEVKKENKTLYGLVLLGFFCIIMTIISTPNNNYKNN